MPKDNLQAASRKATYASNVELMDNIGEDKDGLEAAQGVIESILGQFVERVAANANAIPDFVTSGKILDMEVKSENDSVNVYANPWLIYQDRGVNGATKKLYDTPHSFKDKKPPLEPIKDWIRAKGINLRDNAKYEKGKEHPFVKTASDEEELERVAYAIQNKIYNEGFKPRNIYSKEIPQLVEDLQNEFADFCIQQINQRINISPRDGGGNRIIVQ